MTLYIDVYYKKYQTISSQRTNQMEKACLQEKLENINIVSIAVTTRCSLQCLHCSYPTDIPNETNVFSDNKWASLVDRVAVGTAPKLFAVAAREPLLDENSRRSTLAIVQKAEQLGIQSGIVTNGLRLPEFLPLIRKSGAHPDYIDISLEGPPKVNDAIRGPGTFERVTTNLSQTRFWEHAHKLFISFCLSAWSAQPGPLAEMLHWITFSLPQPRLAVLTIMPESRTDPRLVLRPGDFERALDTLVEASQDFKEIFIDLFPVSLPNLRALTRSGVLPDNNAVLRDSMGNLWGFIANNLYVRYQNIVDFNYHQMYVTPEGLWLPACARLQTDYKDQAFGSVLNDDLKALRGLAEQHAVQEAARYENEECREQPCWRLCRGTNNRCDYLRDRR